jgi:hypothetical protein
VAAGWRVAAGRRAAADRPDAVAIAGMTVASATASPPAISHFSGTRM